MKWTVHTSFILVQYKQSFEIGYCITRLPNTDGGQSDVVVNMAIRLERTEANKAFDAARFFRRLTFP